VKKLFIEFNYKDESSRYLMPLIVLNNGFSTVHNLCDEIKPVWLSEDYQAGLSALQNAVMGFDYDVIYITSLCVSDLYYIKEVAKQMPQTKFVVGGPTGVFVEQGGFKKLHDLPNLEITAASLDTIFENYADRKWGITFPEIPADMKGIVFTYSNSKPCSWRGCKYCGENIYPDFDKCNVVDPMIVNRIPKGDYGRFITLTASENTPDDFFKHLPLINADPSITYLLFWRADKKRLARLREGLEQTVQPQRLRFIIGAEYLTNRMLKYMNKGLKTDDYIETIKLINEFGCQFSLCMIFGWNNLIQEDVEEFKNVLDQIDTTNAVIPIRRLTLNKKIEKRFGNDFANCVRKSVLKFNPQVKDRIEELDTFYYAPIIDKEQEKLNSISRKLLLGKNCLYFLDHYKMLDSEGQWNKKT
jgi:hypothetical protein